MRELSELEFQSVAGGLRVTILEAYGNGFNGSFDVTCKLESNSSTTCTASVTACAPGGTCGTVSLTLNSGQTLACSIVGVGVGAMAAPTGFGSVAGFAASQACNALANSQTGNGWSVSTEIEGN